MATPNPTKAAAPPVPPKSVFAKLFQNVTTLFHRKPKGKEMDLGEHLKMVWSDEYKRWIVPGQKLPDDEKDDLPPIADTGAKTQINKPVAKKQKKKEKVKKNQYANIFKDGEEDDKEAEVKSSIPPQEDIKKDELEVKSQSQSQQIDEIGSQSTKYKELEIQVEQLLQEKDMVDKKASEMEFMLNEYVDEMESEKAYYEEQNKVLYKEKAENSLKLTECEKEISYLKEQLQNFEQQFSELNKEKVELTLKLIQDNTQDQSNKEGTSGDTQGALSGDEDRNSVNNEKAIMEKDDKIFDLQRDLQEMQVKLEEAEAKIKEKENLKPVLAQQEKELKKLFDEQLLKKNEELNELKEDTKQIQEKYDLVISDFEKLKHDSEELEKKYSDSESRWQAENKKLIDDTKDKEQIIQQECEKLKKDLEDAESEIQKLNDDKEDMKSNLNKIIKDNASEIEDLKINMDLYKKDIEKQTKINVELNQKISSLEENEKKISLMEKKNLDVESEIDGLKTDLAKLQEKNTEIDIKYQAKCEEESKINSELSQALKSIEEKTNLLKTLKEECDNQIAEKTKLEESKSDIEKQLSLLTAEKNKVEAKNAEQEKSLKLLGVLKIKMEEIKTQQENMITVLENDKAKMIEKCNMQEKSLDQLKTEKNRQEEMIEELEESNLQLTTEKASLEEKNKELEKSTPEDSSLDEIKEKYNELILTLTSSMDMPQTLGDDMNNKYYEDIIQRNIELEEITTEQKLHAETEQRILKQIETRLEELNAHIGNPGIQLGDSSLSRWSNLLLNLEAIEQHMKKMELDNEQQKAEIQMAECKNLMLERNLKEFRKEFECTKQISLAKDNDLDYYKDLAKTTTEQSQKYQNYCDEIKKEKESIQEKLENVEKEKEKALINADNLKSENVKKAKEIEEEKESKNKINSELIKIQTQIQETKARYDHILEEKAQFEQIKLGLESKNKELMENEKKLQNKLQVLNEERQKILSESKDIKNKFDEINSKYEESQIEIATQGSVFQKELQAEKNKNKQVTDENNKLQKLLSQKESEKSNELKKILDEKKEQEEKIGELSIDIGSLNQNIENISKLNKRFENEIEIYKKEKIDSDSKIQDFTVKIQELEKSMQGQTAEQSSAFEKKIEDLQGEKNLLLQRIEDFEEQVKAQIEEQNLLKKEKTDLGDKLNKEIADKKDLVISSQKQIEELTGKLSQSQENEQKLYQEIEDNKKTYQDILAEQSKEKASVEYDKEIATLRADLDRSRNENKKLLDNYSKLEAANKKQEEINNKAFQFKLLDKAEKTTILQKLKNEGEQFKEFYCNFKENPIKFPGYVIEKMSLTLKEQQQKINELTAMLNEEKNKKVEVVDNREVQEAVNAQSKDEDVHEEKLKKDGENPEEASGVSGWLSSFFLTEGDTQALKKGSPKKK